MKLSILSKGNPSDLKKFSKLPFKLYKDNKFWVPSFPGEIEKVMDPARHPFYSHSVADFIVAESGNEVVGRIAVLHNKNYCHLHQKELAFFYYFESVNDPAVAANLFDAASSWAKKRHLTQIMGPRGFLRSNGMGLLIEGYDHAPAMGILYNQSYYPQFLEMNGFTKYFDHFSGYVDAHPDPIIHKAGNKVLARGKFKVLDFHSIKEILPWVTKLEEVHQKAFENNPDFYPSTKEEFAMIVENITALADPRYIKLILHENDVAGFIIGYPDIGKGLRACKGKILPIGWLVLPFAQRFSRVIDLNGVGLLPEYQGLGGNALLYSELDKVLLDNRFSKGELVQVDERNFRSKSDMITLGVHWTKTHRTYIRDL
jgi:hypothetical protein